MANSSSNDETFVECDEIFYPRDSLIDIEPIYSNFTAIENLRLHQQTIQHGTSSNEQIYQSTLNSVKPQLSSHHYYSDEALYIPIDQSPAAFRVPIKIQSKTIDGEVFNLTRIVQDIGYDRETPFIRLTNEDQSTSTRNVSALLNIVLKMGGAHGKLSNMWRSKLDDDFFQNWYLERQTKNSTSTTHAHNMSHRIDSNNHYYNDQIADESIHRMVSKQPLHTTNHSQIIESQQSRQATSNQSSTTIKELNRNFSTNARPITIRDGNFHEEIQRSTSSDRIYENTTDIVNDYQRILRENTDLYQDPTPAMITKPNPDTVTHRQNISIRYLVPPTPPPPGPLIIREIVPPRPPTPPPLIVTYQEPTPPTPPPLILREAPPPPPPTQEPKIITKVLPPEPQPTRQIIFEKIPAPPPKPQPVIIERWLPYKEAPAREVIYEQIESDSSFSESETNSAQVQYQRRHSADFETNMRAAIPVPVHLERSGSAQNLARSESHVYNNANMNMNQYAWSQHQHLLNLQQQGRAHVAAHQRWAAQQWQQHRHMMMQCGPRPCLPIPNVIISQQSNPVIHRAGYVQHEYRQQRVNYESVYPYQMY